MEVFTPPSVVAISTDCSPSEATATTDRSASALIEAFQPHPNHRMVIGYQYANDWLGHCASVFGIGTRSGFPFRILWRL